MISEIISVGTELLLGQIANTDAKFLSTQLSLLGIDVYFQTNVGDNEKRVKDCLAIAFKRSDIIITTGGLGPTDDDLTKETVASFLELPLVEYEDAKNSIDNYFKKLNQKPTLNNYKQALFPKGSKILPNNFGTAPGCIIEHKGKIIIILPGPPSELIPMFNNYVYPFLRSKSNEIIYSRILKFFGIGESKLEELVKSLLNSSNPTIAPLVGDGFVTLRITAKTSNKQQAIEMINNMERKIKDIVGEYIFAVDDESMESTVVNLLKEKKLTVSTAESCTGGLLAGKITDVPGASEIFNLGLVTYSNKAKQNLLNVKSETLERYGAVSHETAEEMAINILHLAKSDIGVSVTGIAGPDGGTTDKPVGLVYVGFATKEKVDVKKLMLNGSRDKIRNRTVLNALDIIRRYLLSIN
ncbi:MAG: competence/damage-inducible protein A [Thermoanaerobacteraceae bacterium]